MREKSNQFHHTQLHAMSRSRMSKLKSNCRDSNNEKPNSIVFMRRVRVCVCLCAGSKKKLKIIIDNLMIQMDERM